MAEQTKEKAERALQFPWKRSRNGNMCLQLKNKKLLTVQQMKWKEGFYSWGTDFIRPERDYENDFTSEHEAMLDAEEKFAEVVVIQGGKEEPLKSASRFTVFNGGKSPDKQHEDADARSTSASSEKTSASTDKSWGDAGEEVLPSGKMMKHYADALAGRFSWNDKWSRTLSMAAQGFWTVRDIDVHVNGEGWTRFKLDVRQILESVDAEAVAVSISDRGGVSLKPSVRLQELIASR